MKINSKNLYEYINELATNEKVNFKVYYDDTYMTDILWNGNSFQWEPGLFTSEAFFNPLYDFEVIEDKQEYIDYLYTGDRYLFESKDNGMTKEDRKQLDSYFRALLLGHDALAKAVNYLLDKDNNG